MKAITISAFLVLVFFCLQEKVISQTSAKDQNKTEMKTADQSAIEQLIYSYRDALNVSDPSAVISLYTKDGSFMPANAPTAKGQEQLKSSYEFVFKTIEIHIDFFIEEIEVSGDHAYATTHSKGTALIHANNQTVSEENRELFVFQKDNGQWKIARYMFNKTKNQ